MKIELFNTFQGVREVPLSAKIVSIPAETVVYVDETGIIIMINVARSAVLKCMMS